MGTEGSNPSVSAEVLPTVTANRVAARRSTDQVLWLCPRAASASARSASLRCTAA